MGPWIIWSIWKNRNSHLFEGRTSRAPDLISQTYEEADHWFFIKTMEKEEKSIDLVRKKRIIFGWKPPPKDWVKCDIGFAWNKTTNESGASWILRNSDGKTLLHGRRSFVNIHNMLDASLESWLWAMESFRSLHFNSIIFTSEDKDLIAAISKPHAWSSLKFYSQTISLHLHHFLDWQVQFAPRSVFKGAFLIADSVIQGDRFQSYIAAGYPC